MLNKIKSFKSWVLSLFCVLSVLVGTAFAEGGSSSLVDFSTLTSSVQTEVTTALTAVLPFLGLLIGAFIGWKVFKRFAGSGSSN